MSTTVREAERIVGFLKTATEMDGMEWTRANQERFQILLIKNRQYLNEETNTQSFNKLTKTQCNWLIDKSKEMTFAQAEEIFKAKNYLDPAMRGRQSMSALRKLGLVYIVNNRVVITDAGWKLANGKIQFDELMLDSLLKYQYPNHDEHDHTDWNTKPFINTLRLMKRVNELCAEQGIKEKGISSREFGIFALSLKNYKNIEKVAIDLLNFRKKLLALPEVQRTHFEENFIRDYLSDFDNAVHNTKEYTDNMIRYIRLTKYIYIRGKYDYTYIDLEPRRMNEINAILQVDDGSAKEFTIAEWQKYMGTFGAYDLPFETIPILAKIAQDTLKDVNNIESDLRLQATIISLPKEKSALKSLIEKLRAKRTELQNLYIKQSYRADITKIDEVIAALVDIKRHNRAGLAKKFSIELEKWANVALNIINDALRIKPNAPVGDDNEPTYTAPSGVADIECYYKTFNAICEVTMLISRDQWYNEGQPVMRHLRDFENRHSNLPAYCLFIAPTLHTDTVNTFWLSVKYEYDGKKQKIVPITIDQLVLLLRTVKSLLTRKQAFTYSMLNELYEMIINVNQINSYTEWLNQIQSSITCWQNKLIG
jgi:hypothetical protein